MRFINPKTDFAFKKIFASEDSKDILISFLNALVYAGESVIEDLDIIDPYAPPRITGLKDTYLDVKAKLNDGTIVIIEMQVLNVESFGKRVLYNAAKTYTTQLRSGEGYSKLKPVIALTLTDFEMFNNWEGVISRFVFKETQHLFDYTDNQIELVFVELPKFHKELADLETLTDKWIYFMKTAPSLEVVPETMGSIPALNKALRIANEANLSSQELEELDRQIMILEDQMGSILKGKLEGREEGKLLGKIELIMRLLGRKFGNLSPEIEERIRGLSLEQLENLVEAILDFASVGDLLAWLEGLSALG